MATRRATTKRRGVQTAPCDPVETDEPHIALPLDVATVQRRVAEELVRLVVEMLQQPRTFRLTFGDDAQFTVPRDYAFANALVRGETWESLQLAFDAGGPQVAGALLAVVAGWQSPQWTKAHVARKGL